MSLIVITGPVRSGKSAAAERLARTAVESGRTAAVTVAVAGWDGDEEMSRRIEAHRAGRPGTWRTAAADADSAAVWTAEAGDGLLLLDCLGSVIAAIAWEEAGEAEIATSGMESRAGRRADAVVDALASRPGDTIVVTNESGWGLVPPTAAGRLFRDLLGRANRRLVEVADGAYLVVAGRCVDLRACPGAIGWPGEDKEMA